jgi:hypothetical protein
MRPIAIAIIIATLFAGRIGLAVDLPMTAEEFALWKDYTDALSDERVLRKPEKERLPAIARNFKVPEKKLREAVRKGEEHGKDIGGLAERNARDSLSATPVGGRIKELRVDTSNSHVVTYVTWLVDRADQLDEEASLIAARCARNAPLASTLSLRAVDGADRQAFSAIISNAAALRINEARIQDFAHTRFIKLFEKVERAAAP